MKAIINLIKGLVNSITTVIEFITDFFSDLLYVIGLLGQFVVEIPTYFRWLPGECIALITMIFSIVVIYMILNRK